jgi:hypothetical protein
MGSFVRSFIQLRLVESGRETTSPTRSDQIRSDQIVCVSDMMDEYSR